MSKRVCWSVGTRGDSDPEPHRNGSLKKLRNPSLQCQMHFNTFSVTHQGMQNLQEFLASVSRCLMVWVFRCVQALTGGWIATLYCIGCGAIRDSREHLLSSRFRRDWRFSAEFQWRQRQPSLVYMSLDPHVRQSEGDRWGQHLNTTDKGLFHRLIYWWH